MAGFSADFGAAQAALGYVEGIARAVETPAYINDVIGYTYIRMSQAVDAYIDEQARRNPESLHHVYEWPMGWDSSSGNPNRGGGPDWSETVGNPAERLWRNSLIGKGKTRTATYTFLESKRPAPVNPLLVAEGVKENVHIWHWKAPSMEAGAIIHVSPKLSPILAFVTQDGEIITRPVEVETGPAGGGKTTGQFTTAYLTWWSSLASTFFDQNIAPKFAKDLNPNNILERTSMRVGKKSSTKTFNLGVKQYEEAMAEARRTVTQKARIDYINAEKGSEARRAILYGDV